MNQRCSGLQTNSAVLGQVCTITSNVGMTPLLGGSSARILFQADCRTLSPRMRMSTFRIFPRRRSTLLVWSNARGLPRTARVQEAELGTRPRETLTLSAPTIPTPVNSVGTTRDFSVATTQTPIPWDPVVENPEWATLVVHLLEAQEPPNTQHPLTRLQSKLSQP